MNRDQLMDLWCSIPGTGSFDEDAMRFGEALLDRALGPVEYQIRDPGLEVWRTVIEEVYLAHEYYKRRVAVLETVK